MVRILARMVAGRGMGRDQDDLDRRIRRALRSTPSFNAAAPTDGLGIANAIEQLRRLFIGNYPADLRPDHLATPEVGRRYFSGTGVPIIQQPGWVPRPSGLFVPPHAASSTPIDLMEAYVSLSELLGATLTVNELVELLQQYPLDECLRFVAYWLGNIEAMGSNVGLLEQQFIDIYIHQEARQLAVGLHKTGRRFLVPQLLLALAKLAVAVSPDELDAERSPSNEGSLVVVMLGIADLFGEDAEDDSAVNEPHWGGLPNELALELMSNLYFNAVYDEGAQIARFTRMWLELAAALAPVGLAPFSELFEEATGIALMDVAVATFVIWARAGQGQFVVAPAYFDNSALAGDRAVRVLEFLSADRPTLAAALAEESPLGFTWTYSTFERYPIARLRDSTFLVLSPRYLLNRVFGGLCYHDVDTYLRKDRRRRGKLKQLAGSVTQGYVQEALRRIAPDVGTQRRVYEESDLRQAFGSSVQLCDAVIDYGDAFVLVEITSRRLTRESVAGFSVENLNNDIKNLIEAKGEQLDSTIQQLRSNAPLLTGALPTAREYFPVIVTDDQFPVFPGVVEEYTRRLDAAGHLQGEGVARLEIMSLEDVDLVQALAENHGLSLRDVLRAKADAGLSAMSIKNYVLVELQLSPGRPQSTRELFDRFAALAIAHLGFRQEATDTG